MVREPFRKGFTSSLTINAPADAILQAFFDHASLVDWWHITRSLCVPRTLGCYAVEWPMSAQRDETLGRLGGVFHGTVVTFDPQREFFVADAYWMAPDDEPLGPMAFEVTCGRVDGGTSLTVRQSGSDDGKRWLRYYALVHDGLTVSLQRLRTLLESRHPG